MIPSMKKTGNFYFTSEQTDRSDERGMKTRATGTGNKVRKEKGKQDHTAQNSDTVMAKPRAEILRIEEGKKNSNNNNNKPGTE